MITNKLVGFHIVSPNPYIYIYLWGVFCWVNIEVKFTIIQPAIDYLRFVGAILLHMGLTHGASWCWHSCISLLLEHAYALLIGFEGLLSHRRRNVLSTLWLHMPQLLRRDPGKELRLHYQWLLRSPGYTADTDTAKRRRTSPSLWQGRGVSLRLRWRSWKATPATSICYMPFIPMKSPLCWLNHNIPIKHTLYPCYINKGHACHVSPCGCYTSIWLTITNMKQSIQKDRRSHTSSLFEFVGTFATARCPAFRTWHHPARSQEIQPPWKPAVVKHGVSAVKTWGGNKDVWFHRVSLRFSGVHWDFTSTHCCFSAIFLGYHRDIQRTKNWIIKGVHEQV